MGSGPQSSHWRVPSVSFCSSYPEALCQWLFALLLFFSQFAWVYKTHGLWFRLILRQSQHDFYSPAQPGVQSVEVCHRLSRVRLQYRLLWRVWPAAGLRFSELYLTMFSASRITDQTPSDSFRQRQFHGDRTHVFIAFVVSWWCAVHKAVSKCLPNQIIQSYCLASAYC